MPIESVVDVAQHYRAMQVDEIDVADTIGVGTPQRVRDVMAAVTRVVDPARVSGHFHDTYGQALANILASLETGISIFHASVAGLGGCPYAKGATGNVATEDVLYMPVSYTHIDVYKRQSLMLAFLITSAQAVRSLSA